MYVDAWLHISMTHTNDRPKGRIVRTLEEMWPLASPYTRLDAAGQEAAGVQQRAQATKQLAALLAKGSLEAKAYVAAWLHWRKELQLFFLSFFFFLSFCHFVFPRQEPTAVFLGVIIGSCSFVDAALFLCCADVRAGVLACWRGVLYLD